MCLNKHKSNTHCLSKPTFNFISQPSCDKTKTDTITEQSKATIRLWSHSYNFSTIYCTSYLTAPTDRPCPTLLCSLRAIFCYFSGSMPLVVSMSTIPSSSLRWPNFNHDSSSENICISLSSGHLKLVRCTCRPLACVNEQWKDSPLV